MNNPSSATVTPGGSPTGTTMTINSIPNPSSPSSSDNMSFGPSAPIDPSAVVDLDSRGDLLLQVGKTTYSNEGNKRKIEDEPITYRVCSRTMSRASRVFERILYGDSRESKKPKDGAWVVSLPDDNPEAMKAFLDIIHATFHDGPITAYLRSYDLAVISGKYDLAHLLRPWAADWMEDCRAEYGDFRTTAISCLTELEDQLWIAWELGDEDQFCTVVLMLALHLSANTDGDLVGYHFGKDKALVLFEDAVEVPGAVELIKDTRRCLIEDMLAPLETAVANIGNGQGTNLKCRLVAVDDPNFDTCTASLYGTMVWSLAAYGLWPLPLESEVLMSPNKLNSFLGELEMVSQESHRNSCHLLKENNLWKDFRGNIMKFQRPRLTRLMERHLQTQAKKTGLTGYEFQELTALSKVEVETLR